MYFYTKNRSRNWLLAIISVAVLTALSLSTPTYARSQGGGNQGRHGGGNFGSFGSDRGRNGGDPYGYDQRMNDHRNSRANQDWNDGGNSRVIPGQYPGQGHTEGYFPGQGNTQGVYPGRGR